jgi:GNAT superfamily N-acetyltransferase
MDIIKAKPEDAASIAAVHIESWRETYKGIVPADFLASLSQDQRHEMWLRILTTDSGEFVRVAKDQEGRVIGFASGGLERSCDQYFKGELYSLYLLRQFHGQGVGRYLFFSVVEGLLSLGLNNMRVWVLADNPFRRFYESQGGQLVYEKQIIIGGKSLQEVSYGWLDLSGLVK